MELDRSSRLPEVRPREHGQAQIDSCGVQSVDGLVQIVEKRLFAVIACGPWQSGVRQICIYTPVSDLVCIGQGVARNWSPDSHVVEFPLLCPKAGFDIPQTLPVCDLGKGHAVILIEAGEFLDLVVAMVMIYALVKDVERKKLHHLRENHFSGIHRQPPRKVFSKDGCFGEKISSR